jgi:hypothetical protein
MDPMRDPWCYSIMGRIHVSTPDSDALIHACESLRDPAGIEAKALFYFAARCLAAHHNNLDEYRRVMGGLSR